MIDLTEWTMFNRYGFNKKVGLLDDQKGIIVIEHGEEIIGDHILKYIDEDDNRLVFILDGATDIDFIYRLIWKG